MPTPNPEFDGLAQHYDALLDDPLRQAFTCKSSDFFHTRKRDLILAYFRQMNVNTPFLRHLDVGCGRGELLALLRSHFGCSAGCDPSRQMIRPIDGIDMRIQESPDIIPFESAAFDVVTTVCVYHHVRPAARSTLTAEIRRVLAPGGTFIVIEHNPYNPVTKIIVNRTPVDSNAILLKASECQELLGAEGFLVDAIKYFLYFPEYLYRRLRYWEERFARVPLGGQYAVFSHAK